MNPSGCIHHDLVLKVGSNASKDSDVAAMVSRLCSLGNLSGFAKNIGDNRAAETDHKGN